MLDDDREDLEDRDAVKAGDERGYRNPAIGTVAGCLDSCIMELYHIRI
jgi:hypothetical protein